MNERIIKHPVAYDEEADVLYVTFGTEPSYCEDIDKQAFGGTRDVF